MLAEIIHDTIHNFDEIKSEFEQILYKKESEYEYLSPDMSIELDVNISNKLEMTINFKLQIEYWVNDLQSSHYELIDRFEEVEEVSEVIGKVFEEELDDIFKDLVRGTRYEEENWLPWVRSVYRRRT